VEQLHGGTVLVVVEVLVDVVDDVGVVVLVLVLVDELDEVDDVAVEEVDVDVVDDVVVVARSVVLVDEVLVLVVVGPGRLVLVVVGSGMVVVVVGGTSPQKRTAVGSRHGPNKLVAGHTTAGVTIAAALVMGGWVGSPMEIRFPPTGALPATRWAIGPSVSRPPTMKVLKPGPGGTD